MKLISTNYDIKAYFLNKNSWYPGQHLQATIIISSDRTYFIVIHGGTSALKSLFARVTQGC